MGCWFRYDLHRIDQEGVVGGATVAEKRVDLAYNAAGQFTAIARYKDTDGGSGNLVVDTAFAYDLIGRLTDLTHTHDTTTIADYQWDYDAFGHVTLFTFNFSDGDDGSSAFSYDATGQLVDADHTAQADEAFSYDENGNRTMTGYNTGSNNLVISDGTFDYVYDLEGNRISKTRISTDPADDKTVEYTWDHRNRLTRVLFKNNAGVVTKEVLYEYDVFNRRITKIIDADGAGPGVAAETDFIYLCSCQLARAVFLAGRAGGGGARGGFDGGGGGSAGGMRKLGSGAGGGGAAGVRPQAPERGPTRTSCAASPCAHPSAPRVGPGQCRREPGPQRPRPRRRSGAGRVRAARRALSARVAFWRGRGVLHPA